MKLLAAASSLSIQAHPSRAQAIEAFAREEAAGIPRDAPERTYRDENHKPELIVAVSETFTALAGVRDLDDDPPAARRCSGPAATALAARLEGPDAAASVRDTIEWLLSGDAAEVIAAIVAAAVEASPGRPTSSQRSSTSSAALAVDFPGDRGVGVALLMNLVVLRRGEGLFVPAGVLHAYQAGLGVEIMAASDNVLRGGLTPKHVDVGELVTRARSHAGSGAGAAARGPRRRGAIRAGCSRLRAHARRRPPRRDAPRRPRRDRHRAGHGGRGDRRRRTRRHGRALPGRGRSDHSERGQRAHRGFAARSSSRSRAPLSAS